MLHSSEPCYIVQADIDNSGTIDYGEFIAATIHLNKLEREEHLVAAFQYFDKDGSGSITIDELQQACQEQGLNDLYLEDVIREVDQNNVSLVTPHSQSHFSASPFVILSTYCIILC